MKLVLYYVRVSFYSKHLEENVLHFTLNVTAFVLFLILKILTNVFRFFSFAFTFQMRKSQF